MKQLRLFNIAFFFLINKEYLLEFSNVDETFIYTEFFCWGSINFCSSIRREYLLSLPRETSLFFDENQQYCFS